MRSVTVNEARALGILAGLQGEPPLWRHPGATDPARLRAWRDGHREASAARRSDRVAEQQRRAEYQRRVQPLAADDPLARIFGRMKVLRAPAEA